MKPKFIFLIFSFLFFSSSAFPQSLGDSTFIAIYPKFDKSTIENEKKILVNVNQQEGWSAFWGAALGALVSSIVALCIFRMNNNKEENKRKKADKALLKVIIELFCESIRNIDSFIHDINKIEETYEEYKKSNTIVDCLPYKEPYSVNRLKDLDIHRFSDLMSGFDEIKGFPQIITDIDYASHYISFINDSFAKYDDDLRQKKNQNKVKEIFEKIMKDTKGNGIGSNGMIFVLQEYRDKFDSFCKQLK